MEEIIGFLMMFVGSSVQVMALGLEGVRLPNCLGSSNLNGFFQCLWVLLCERRH
jgi:hypothetical protein